MQSSRIPPNVETMIITRLQSRLTALFLIMATMTGCGGNKSRTTDTNSAGFATVEEKKRFLEQYVNFRRTYDELEFDVAFTDGGDGFIPSPTEWDIRILAKVPANEMDAWTDGLAPAKDPDSGWLKEIPNAPDEFPAFVWVTDGKRLVGYDRESRYVVYRSFSQ